MILFAILCVHAGNDWVQRFHALREKAEVATQPERLGKEPDDVSIYARDQSLDHQHRAR